MIPSWWLSVWVLIHFKDGHGGAVPSTSLGGRKQCITHTHSNRYVRWVKYSLAYLRTQQLIVQHSKMTPCALGLQNTLANYGYCNIRWCTIHTPRPPGPYSQHSHLCSLPILSISLLSHSCYVLGMGGWRFSPLKPQIQPLLQRSPSIVVFASLIVHLTLFWCFVRLTLLLSKIINFSNLKVHYETFYEKPWY